MKDYFDFDQGFICKSFSFPKPQDIATSKIRHLHCLPISALDISYNTDSSNVRMPLTVYAKTILIPQDNLTDNF